MRPTPAVSVAVVSWNTRELLDACLTSLRPDAEAGTADVWVVDNGSTDGSAALVRERHPFATLVEAGENLGFGRAVNLVAQRTSTPWVAAANADVALAPGALPELLRAGAADPVAGAIAPALHTPGGEVQHSVHPHPTLARTLAFNLGVPGVGERLALPGRWDASRSRRVDWVHGAFVLVRREAWDAVGGFDPAQWLYAEDLDLCWRLREAGWATRFEPRAVATHAVSAATTQAFGDDREAVAQAAFYTWMRRRRGRARTRAFAAVNVVGAVARAGPRPTRARMLHHARLHVHGLR